MCLALQFAKKSATNLINIWKTPSGCRRWTRKNCGFTVTQLLPLHKYNQMQRNSQDFATAYRKIFKLHSGDRLSPVIVSTPHGWTSFTPNNCRVRTETEKRNLSSNWYPRQSLVVGDFMEKKFLIRWITGVRHDKISYHIFFFEV